MFAMPESKKEASQVYKDKNSSCIRIEKHGEFAATLRSSGCHDHRHRGQGVECDK